MDVILVEDFPSLGYVGERVRVKDGYARNYLIPRGIVVSASSRQGRVLKHKLSMIEAKRARLRKGAEEVVGSMNSAHLQFELKVGEHGKSFGSITGRDIADQLNQKGFEVDKRQVKLQEPIRSAGEYLVEVKLHSEVAAQVPVTVTADTSAQKQRSKAQSDAEENEAGAMDEEEQAESAADADEFDESE